MVVGGAGWLVLISPPGRMAIAAGGARLLLRGVRPGTYPRGGSVHVRLWAAERLAELSGAANLAGASWISRYARALGAKIGTDVDLHCAAAGHRAAHARARRAVEPEVDLAGYWLDGDGCASADPDRRRRHGRRRAARCCPGARIGKGAEVPPGSAVPAPVPAGQRWAGSPAQRVGKAERAWPPTRPPRRAAGRLAYGVASMLLGAPPRGGGAARAS